MKQIVNPFLPSYEYIPDPEPRVFDGRVYIYGSHDRFNGMSFCLNDYVTWSAPIDDLSNWRYEGVIYERENDPRYGKGPLNAMFASDVIKASDGKYYMYYTLGYCGYISIAVSDSPAGKYEFLGHVKYQDGILLGDKNEGIQFDPAIFIDDDKRVYLYSGFAPKKLSRFLFRNKKPMKEGAMVVELKSDMQTVISKPKYIAKTIFNSKDTEYYGHEFFEAPSMRKINNKYYFIYSSINGHELCYAVSDYPDKDFKYQGILVSNGDIGIKNKPVNYIGNNHGSILRLKDDFYIFYHRQTNRNSFSRQACAEKIEFEDGKFIQAEITSNGLNNSPIKAKGKHMTYIACNLYSKKGVYFYRVFKKRSKYHAYFTQDSKDRNENPNQYIKNFTKYSIAGFKYFEFSNEKEIEVEIKGKATGNIIVKNGNDELLATISINSKTNKFKANLKDIKGIHEIQFNYEGKGNFDFISFEIK